MVASLSLGTLGLLSGCSGNDQENPDVEESENGDGESTETDSDDESGKDNNSGEEGVDEENASKYTVGFEHPDAVFPDQPFEMIISGLPPEKTVKIRLGDSGRPRSAAAKIQTNQGGRVNIDEATIVGGDVPQEVNVPLPVVLHQFVDLSFRRARESGPQTAQYSLEIDGEDIGSTTVTRRHPNIESAKAIDHDEIVGDVFEPTNGGPGPGVVVLHGSNAIRRQYVAGLLAQRGFTAVALQYFDAPGLPKELMEVPLGYVETTTEWLLDHKSVTGDQVGLLGYSKGAELALLAGSQFESVGAAVSISGSGVTWQGFSNDVFSSSWALNGDPTPYISLVDEGWEGNPIQGYTNSLEAASEEEIEAATIPVEEINGPVLLISGGEDRIWNAVRLHRIAEERLANHDHPSFDHLVYDDAGHVITPPYLGLSEIEGGTRAGKAEASHDHWPQVRETLSALE